MSHGDEPCDIWCPVQHTARADRQCDACGETISAGTRYTRLSSLYDGYWQHSDHCGRCWAIFEAVCETEQVYARGHQGYPRPIDPRLDCGESWRDAFGVDEPDHIAELAFMLPHETHDA